ncbi:MAG: HIRAN domain-containing protein [Betaproteobacteria bacterium]
MTRSPSSALLVLFLAAGSAVAADGGVRLVVQSSPLAGYRYHAAAQVLAGLRVGDTLELAREPHNAHDASAVSVSWRGHKLGYVPRRENGALAWAMDRGEAPRARISRLAPQAAPSRRIEFEVTLE